MEERGSEKQRYNQKSEIIEGGKEREREGEKEREGEREREREG